MALVKVGQGAKSGQGKAVLNRIYIVGAIMLALIAIHTVCSYFVDYQGHMMVAKMESEIRADLFDHYQSLSFGFYDTRSVGWLMARLTSDCNRLSNILYNKIN